MARASIVYKYADGDTVQVFMETCAEHPDALDEIATRCVRMYRETVPGETEPES